MYPNVHALANNKGGAAKTTDVAALLHRFAAAGLDTLGIDMDPQGDLTRRLAAEDAPGDKPQLSIADLLKDAQPGTAAQAIRQHGWGVETRGALHLIPGRVDLENRVSEAGVIGAGDRLAIVLDGVAPRYDVVLIDCPPSIGHLTVMSLVAAGKVLIPVRPEYDPIRGALRIRDMLTAYRRSLGETELLGVIVNDYDSRLILHRERAAGLREEFGGLVIDPYIRKAGGATGIATAMDRGVPISTVAPVLVEQFDDVAKTIARRAGVAWPAVAA